MPIVGSREDQYEVTVTVEGGGDKLILGVFDKMTGGDQDSEETKYKPGGMGPELSLGGQRMVTNITVTRLYALDRDHGIVKRLMNQVGGGLVTLVKQPLDAARNPFGSPITYKGTLKSVKLPDHDSNSSSAGLMELEISTAGTIG